MNNIISSKNAAIGANHNAIVGRTLMQLNNYNNEENKLEMVGIIAKKDKPNIGHRSIMDMNGG